VGQFEFLPDLICGRVGICQELSVRLRPKPSESAIRETSPRGDEKTVKPIAGVRSVQANLLAAKVTVSHDERVTPEQLIAAIKPTGMSRAACRSRRASSLGRKCAAKPRDCALHFGRTRRPRVHCALAETSGRNGHTSHCSSAQSSPAAGSSFRRRTRLTIRSNSLGRPSAWLLRIATSRRKSSFRFAPGSALRRQGRL
jgi:hypothetical protein